jgi:hypothetical protein
MTKKTNALENLTAEERYRAHRANEIYHELIAALGAEPESLHSLVGWAEFILGDIDEAELCQKALDSLDPGERPTIH